MTEWLPDFVQQRSAELAREQPHLKSSMEAAGGLLLYGTIGGEGYLRPDGSVWLNEVVDWVNDPERSVWREASGNDRWGALVLGSRRLPELRQLLPARPAGTPDCSRCEGSGFVLGGVLCPDCAGLGWIAQGAA